MTHDAVATLISFCQVQGGGLEVVTAIKEENP